MVEFWANNEDEYNSSSFAFINLIESNNKMKKYYPEIDGLRAIAVLAVLAFHLNPNGLFTGGYVGVDIFFVISGYLITGIIYQSITNNNFNYFQFLNRRIARLYPALLFTIFVILILGFLIYSTEFYTDAANKIKYTIFSISNIKFMKQGGYWDVSSTESPLLHTWSLGVEQQFYLTFPLVLFAVYKVFKSKRSIIFSIIIISVLSLCVAQYLSIKNPSANFYFTLSRLFELGTGGIFAIVGTRCKVISNTKKEILFSFGLVLILLCAIYYVSDIKYHPGVTTLPVVIGSVLCILYGDAKYAGRIVRTKFVVYIGAISYSIYLIHWPLITFYKYLYQQTDLNAFEQIALLLITIAIASLMYHLIENKYRRISISVFTKTGKIFLTLFIFLYLINFSVTYFKGIPQRLTPYSEDTMKTSSYAGRMPEYSEMENKFHIYGNKDKQPIAIFVGDSYLGQYVEQINLFLKEKNISAFFLESSGCLFINDIYSPNYNYMSCKDITKKYLTLLKKGLPIIRINNFSEANDHINKNDFFYDKELKKTKVTLPQIIEKTFSQSINNKMLIVLSQPSIPHTIDINGISILKKLMNISDKESIKYGSDISRVYSNNEFIYKIKRNSKIEYIEIYDLFCSKSNCTNSNNENIFYYSHSGHLSRAGAKLVWDNIGERVYSFILENQKPIN